MGMTPDSIRAEREDPARAPEAYCELAMTGAVVAGVSPLERREVASYLRGILRLPPMSRAPFYEPHRAILGALLLELETFALLDADEVVEPADLRDPAVLAREREAVRGFRDWASVERTARTEAYHEYVTSLLDHP